MAGYIFALGKDNPFSIYENCASSGVYSTSMSTLKSVPFEGTLADYATMKAGDNIYFFFARKIYGIGIIINIKSDCKYCNYPKSCLPKQFEYEEVSDKLLVDYGKTSVNNRWICVFRAAPHFYRNGVDMDDILTYKPNSFKSLRAFWKISFLKIGDEENQSLKEILMLRNKESFGNPTEDNVVLFDGELHKSIESKLSSGYSIRFTGLLDKCAEDTYIKHEMAIEAATLHQITRNDSLIFGKWHQLFHQVVASPFKPIDYMDKIDILGYRFLEGTNIISKYLVIEIKKDIADVDAVSQLAKYVDWVCKEYAYGDYSAVEGYVLAHGFTEEAVDDVDRICVRYYTQGSHPIENKEWMDVKLICYSYENGEIQYRMN